MCEHGKPTPIAGDASACREAVAGGDFLDQVVQQMPAGVIVAEAPSGRLLLANRRAVDVYGPLDLAKDWPSRMAALEARHPDGRPYAEHEYPLIRALDGEVVTAEEVDIRRGDGSRITLSVNAAPVRDRTGAIALVVLAFDDISERKQSDRALQESRERYHALFEQMSEGFALHEIICDESGRPYDYRFLDINPAFERLTGLTREHVVGRTLREVLPDEDPYWVQAYGSVALTGEPLQTERYAPSLDRYYSVIAYRPAPRQFAVVFLDVTDRKRMEESVRVNLTKYSVLFRSLPLGVTVSDAEGRILESNAEAARILGLGSEEHARRTIDGAEWRLVRPDGTPMPPEEFASVRALKERRRVADVQMGIVKEDGQVTWISVTAEPLPLEGYGVVIAYTDITGRKRTEQALLEAERARAELAETLVSEIGHRTKNNLAIVAGLLQMQLNREEHTASAADTIHDAITRIMSFAALHEQMYQSRTDSIELLDALRRIAEINRRALGAEGVSISVEGEPLPIPPGLGTNLCVMANELLTNAFKHGCPSEERCEIRISLSADESRLALSVWNTGNPVPEDFDIQAAARTGLDLVRSMAVEQYGGSFTLAPHRGGTLASVVLDKARLLEYP